MLVLLLSMFLPVIAYAEGEGNIDNGGGGMGSGTNENYWNVGDEGVRVTVVRASDRVDVTTPVDFTNKTISETIWHFGKVSKLEYKSGRGIAPSTAAYVCKKVALPMPRIISSGSGQASIDQIKSYFTDELVIRYIADTTGMNYDVLINGEYKLLLEPIAYMTFQGVKMAMTATEAALYDQQLNGGLRSRMVSLSHKNLPLAMFLETPDLGYPAWDGSTTTPASNTDIISSLGLGIVRFNEAEPEPPEVTSADYEYRVNTDVITSVTVRGGQSDPDHPITVSFIIGGQTYNVGTIYYPADDSQFVWVRWRTPSTP